uniref:Uncharacterized protein n=1 Tax=Eutreptiella gymnastica TaxID=73025 RepID=A0A7S4GAX5_9EUGL
MAQAEASIIASSNLAQLHAQQPDNIQSADVILKVLNDHVNILVTKWDDNKAPHFNNKHKTHKTSLKERPEHHCLTSVCQILFGPFPGEPPAFPQDWWPAAPSPAPTTR